MKRVNLMTIVGVILALFAAIGTYSVMKKHSATEQVVVVTSYIPPHSQVTQQMVAAQAIPTSAVPAGAVLPSEPVIGHYTTAAIYPGQVMVQGDLASTKAGGSAGLLGELSANDRAFSVEVAEASSAAGDIVPGDQVDVIAVAGNSGSGASGASNVNSATTVVQHVTVLGSTTATAANAGASSSTPASSSSSSPPPATSSSAVYTLALTPTQVQLVALAEASGTLYLSLDPVSNPSTFGGPAASPGDLQNVGQIGPTIVQAATAGQSTGGRQGS